MVLPADIDENPLPDEEPVALAHRLASSKAQAVATRLSTSHLSPAQDAVVIAADTVVALGSLLLGKPEDDDDATRMLALLRDRDHEVHSAVSLFDTAAGRTETVVNSTRVWMRNYSDEEIARYVASGDPMDKAGGYAIQHPEFNPAQRISGCLSGVIGLPLGDLYDLLLAAGVRVDANVAAVCEAQTHFACCQRDR
jgi:septum formation protein